MPSLFASSSDKTNPNETERLLTTNENDFERLSKPVKSMNELSTYGSVNSLDRLERVAGGILSN